MTPVTSASPGPADSVLSRAAALPDAVVRYAAHEDGVIDLHLPDGPGPRPLVITVHGGFWKQRYDRTHQRPLARALVAAGAVVAAPEYRRVGGAGGWPATGDDVLAAYAALPDLLDGLGVSATTAACELAPAERLRDLYRRTDRELKRAKERRRDERREAAPEESDQPFAG